MLKVYKNQIAVLLLSALGCSPSLSVLADSDQHTLEEVEVTARKRPESLQQVPVAVSVFEAKDISVMGVDSLDEFSRAVPNLSFDFTSPLSGSSNAASIYIRGVGQSDFILTSDPGVGIYLDGVYLGRSLGAVLDTVDIARVEILRGPQGSLFGKNTIGGAINVTSQAPAVERSGSIGFSLGSDQRRDLMLSADLPLIDETLLSHIALVSRNQDGYISRSSDGEDLGNENSLNLRASLLWKPSSAWQATLRMDRSRVREYSAPVGFAADSATELETNIANSSLTPLYNAVVGPTTSVPGWGDGVLYDERFYTGNTSATHASGSNYSRLDASGASLEVTWLKAWVDIKSITAYRELHSRFGRDPDHSPLAIIETWDRIDQHQFSQVVQLSGTLFDGRLNWLGGVYYFEESGRDALEARLMPDLPGLVIDGDYSINNDSEAIFLHASYRINEKWGVSGGLRQTHEIKRYTSRLRNGFSGQLLLPTDEYRHSFNHTAPSLGLEYQLGKAALLYGTVSRGFKSGGFDGRYSSPQPAPTIYDPETLTTYEFGLKGEWLEKRLRLNAALFQSDYKDMQFDVFEGVVQVTRNAAESEIRGAELELMIFPSPRLKWTVNLGYIDTDYIAVDPGTGISKSNLFVNTPQWSAYTSLEYLVNVNSFGEFTWRIDYSWQDEVANDAFNTASLMVRNVNLVNASVSYSSPGNPLVVSLYGRNLTDTQTIVSGSNFIEALGFVEAVYSSPREFGLIIAYDF